MIKINHMENKNNSKDFNKSILFIGESEYNNSINKIVKPINKQDALKKFGNSILYKAYETSYNVGNRNIYCVNAKFLTDYIEILKTLIQYNFEYIVPIGINFSDGFYSNKLNRKVSFPELYLKYLCTHTYSNIVFTDKHASLYDNIDDYLLDMTNKILYFKQLNSSMLELYGDRILLIANNLEDYKKSNIIFSSVLALNDLGNYPKYDFKKAIFDIDNFDIGTELIYFKNNININTTIENLLNFRNKQDILKDVLINNIVRYIIMNLNFERYKGSIPSAYIKISVHDYIKDFLSKLMPNVINEFKILDISFEYNNDFTNKLLITLSLTPAYFINGFELYLEV